MNIAKSVLGRSRYIALREAWYHYRDIKARELEHDAIESNRWRMLTNHQHIKAYKDRHQGERCFIIGNGPSLNQMDLSPLRNEYTFGLNRFYLMFPKLGFDTTYLVCVNALVIEQCAQELAELNMPKFFSMAANGLIRMNSKSMFMQTVGGSCLFSHDLTNVVWESATVTYVALQVAYYMGFEQVVLLGVDHNFQTKGPANETVVSEQGDPNHFSPDYFGKGFRWQLPDLQQSEAGYELAKQTFALDGRSVVDATVAGKLNIFPKVDFKDLF